MCDLTDKVVSLPCGHCYHEVCLMRYLEFKKECAECRLKLTDSSESIRKLFLFDEMSLKEIQRINKEYEKLSESERVNVKTL